MSIWPRFHSPVVAMFSLIRSSRTCKQALIVSGLSLELEPSQAAPLLAKTAPPSNSAQKKVSAVHLTSPHLTAPTKAAVSQQEFCLTLQIYRAPNCLLALETGGAVNAFSVQISQIMKALLHQSSVVPYCSWPLQIDR